MNYIVFLNEFIWDGIVDVEVIAFNVGREPFRTGSELCCDVEAVDFGGGRNLFTEFNGPDTGRSIYWLGGFVIGAD
jgi:hypothetical protein